MQRIAVSLSVALPLLMGVASVFGQMFVNPNGTGEVLLYPFYTAARGNDTYIHIVNRTDLVKAVKVRFREAHNGATAYDFNLYLSPFDHWSAAITLDLEGDGGAIRTIDQSCTVPPLGGPNPPFDGSIEVVNNIVDRRQPFTNFDYLGDTPNHGIERTLQGFLEVIEMGQMEPEDLPNNAFDDYEAYLADDENDKPSGAIHGADGVPFGCEKLDTAWRSQVGAWVNNPGDEFLPVWQGGGLYGFGTLINVQDGTAAGFDAIAISNFVDPQTATGALHTGPDSTGPDWRDGVSSFSVPADSGVRTYHTVHGVDAVSGLFMSASISNDYVVDAGLRANTDWVMTQPTRQFYVGSENNPPYRARWNGTTACESLALRAWDREALVLDMLGGIRFPGIPPSPDPDDLELCTQVTIVGYGTDSAVRSNTDIYYGLNGYLGGIASGEAELSFTKDEAHFLQTVGGSTLRGLPFVGYAVITYRNDDADLVVPGVLAAYASATEHKRRRHIDHVDAD